ncbi:phosphate signaling complex PhoU family protein [Natronobiforma cellulositropha]|uniref:phosphate signaling complex PhoU family protein n=1 Tax=Natronobiforma cellulositropha TaxID=1679076 RepID=UPI0021D59935|nr:phosphate uptake regulator PhoU [Natronobiforma cellulositropha]
MSQYTPEAVTRKVQLTGSSTYVISIPKAWARSHGLESGMSMQVYPSSDRLLIAPTPIDDGERSTVIDVAETSPELAFRRITAAYVRGSDRIDLVGVDRIDEGLRRRFVRSIGTFVGFEVVDERPDVIVARDLLDPADVSLPQTVAQLRTLALEMLDDALEAVLTGDDALAQRVVERDDEVDRLFAFVARGFHRGLVDVHEVDRFDIDRSSAFQAYDVARQLERVADHAERIARQVDGLPAPSTPPVADHLSQVATAARDVVELALAGEHERALAEASRAESALERADAAFRSDAVVETPAESYAYGLVLESLRRTALYGVNVVDATAHGSVLEAAGDGGG